MSGRVPQVCAVPSGPDLLPLLPSRLKVRAIALEVSAAMRDLAMKSKMEPKCRACRSAQHQLQNLHRRPTSRDLSLDFTYSRHPIFRVTEYDLAAD